MKAVKEFNVGMTTVVEHLHKEGFVEVVARPNTKLTPDMYEALQKKFNKSKALKERAEQIEVGFKKKTIEPPIEPPAETATPPATTEKKAEESTVVESAKPEEDKSTTVEAKVESTTSEPAPTAVPEEKVEAPKPETPAAAPIDKVEETIIETPTLTAQPKEIVPPVEVEQPKPSVEAKELPTVKEEEPKPQVKSSEPETAPTPTPEVKEELPPAPTPVSSPVDEDKSKAEAEPKSSALKDVAKDSPKEKVSEKPSDSKDKAPEVTASPLKVLGKVDLDAIKSNNSGGGNKKGSKDNDRQKKGGGNSDRRGDNRSKQSANRSDQQGANKNKKKNKQKNKKDRNDNNSGSSFSFDRKPDQPKKPKTISDVTSTPTTEPPVDPVKREVPKLAGFKVVGKIDLKKNEPQPKPKRKRKRIIKTADGSRTTVPAKSSGRKGGGGGNSSGGGGGDRRRSNNRGNKGPGRGRNAGPTVSEVSEKEIQDKIKATMAKMAGGGSLRSKSAGRVRKRKQKKEQAALRGVENVEEKQHLQVTEFIQANELAKLMDISVTDIITTCFNLGIIVSINQRLDAEVIELVTEEFGYTVEFIDVAEQEEFIEEEDDDPEDLEPRSPIVTIMGHVDHGKTSLLDYLRNANVAAGEAGGITQHIGAYEVRTEDGQRITFLDTPGHEAFTAMRARGAKVTDVTIIVIAADDSIMPQTKEAISHAQAAGVPMIFAINKIDKDGADPERIKSELAQMNLLVEDWGGEYQSQDISAKMGTNIDELLEKVLLQAEMLELKANPERPAIGTVIEASLDKGRGFISTILVQKGSLKIGDIILAGQFSGRVKAMFNERGKKVKVAGPSAPVLTLGLNGAPQAGDKVRVMDSEQEARAIATKRSQILRSQQQRANKHITLDEIGRRLALGDFQELNLIVKGDVDGSVQALSDSLLKLSTAEIQVNIIHRSVGAIKESDVLLATASDAIIVGFQVRPTPNARKQAENENIDIRLYSIIYDAIDEIKSAMEGMLKPKVEERFVCNIEVRNTFKISKVGTIAGCVVMEGKVNKDTKIRLIRDGVVAYTGTIDTLRRFKDEAKEVLPGQECGISIKNYNDIKVGDIIEGYEEIEIKRTLK